MTKILHSLRPLTRSPHPSRLPSQIRTLANSTTPPAAPPTKRRSSLSEYLSLNKPTNQRTKPLASPLTAAGTQVFTAAVRAAEGGSGDAHDYLDASNNNNSNNNYYNKNSAAANSGEVRPSQSSNYGDETRVRSKIGRAWVDGDLYAPKDFDVRENEKWSMRRRPILDDPFEKLGRSPLDFYKNPSVLSQYITQTALIKPRRQTGLSPKNQRLMAKAVRRAIGLGLIPSTYHHPNLLDPSLGRK